MKFLSREEVILKFLQKEKHFVSSPTELEKKNAEKVIELSEFFTDEEIEELENGFNDDTYLIKSAPSHTVDLRKFDYPDKDIQDNGKCSAWALTSCMENMSAQNGRVVDLSEWHLWSLYKKYSCAAAVKAAENIFICDAKYWPQYSGPKDGIDNHKNTAISRFRYISSDVELMMNALDQGHIVYLGMSTPRDMLKGKTTIDADSALSGGGHALAVVGYYKDMRIPGGVVAILRNSWGKHIGDGGYQYFPIQQYVERTDAYILMWQIEEVRSKLDSDYQPKKQKVCTKWRRKYIFFGPKICKSYKYI